MLGPKRILAAILALIVSAFFVDVLLVPWFPLPAVLYALFIIVAAHVLSPSLVLVVAIWDSLAVLLAAWVQRRPWEEVILFESGLLVLGYLTIALSKRTRREAELKAAMSSLAEERQRVIETLRALIDSLPVAVFVCDGKGTVTLTSAMAASLLASGAIAGTEVLHGESALYGSDGRPLSPEEHPILRCLQQAVPVSDVEVRVRPADGREQILLAAASPIRDRQGAVAGAVAVVQDITAQRQTQAQLLQQQRALAALEERERLARELHDNLGQVLAYVSYQAEAIRKLLADGYAVTAGVQLGRVIDVARQAQTDVREHITGLRMAKPHGKELLAAVDDYLRQFEEDSGLGTELTVADGVARLQMEPATKVQLLRIIQEALTNVRKHASARRVRVTFAVQEAWVAVTIEDDGCGFDGERFSVDGGRRYGLQIMRERAQEVGGKFQVISAPDRGTKIAVLMPVREEDDRS